MMHARAPSTEPDYAIEHRQKKALMRHKDF